MRRRYAPLVTACTLSCITPESTPTQIYNEGEYQPDREGTSGVPCGLCPIVSASAKDGTWPEVRSNKRLSSMQWYANGAKIETLADWTNKYTILTDGDTRGTLLIRRNVGLNERIRLRFEASLLDERTGEIVAVRSEETTLYTSEAAEDAWAVETDFAPNVTYSPLDDNLLLHDYQTSHGIASTLTSADISDGNQYLRTAAIRVRRGTAAQTSGYQLKLYRTDTGTEQQLTAGGGELTALSLTSMTLDLRVVPNGATYLLKVLDTSGKLLVKKTLCTVTRMVRPVTVKPLSSADIYPDAVQMWQKAAVTCRDRDVESPEHVLKMQLVASTAYESDVVVGEGCKVAFALGQFTIGNTTQDNYVTTAYEYDYKPVYTMATDADGNQYVDENGNPFIFN